MSALRQNADVTAIVTDIVMPNMNGIQFGKQLEMLGNPLPVIYMSGYWEDLDPTGDLAKAGAHVLQKPFQMHELLNRLEQLKKPVPETSGSST